MNQPSFLARSSCDLQKKQSAGVDKELNEATNQQSNAKDPNRYVNLARLILTPTTLTIHSRSGTTLDQSQPILSEQASNSASVPRKKPIESNVKQIPTRSKRTIDASADRGKNDVEQHNNQAKFSSRPFVEPEQKVDIRRTTRQCKKTKTC